MEDKNITVIKLDPINFESQEYIPADVQLIASSSLDTNFQSETDYIEYYIFDENQNKIYPDGTLPLTSFTVKEGDVLLNPISDLEGLEYDLGKYNIIYHFYRKHLSSDITNNYFISEISSDRTEIRLDSNTISNESIISSVNEFITYRDNQPYFVDFFLNFGGNQNVIANNIQLDTSKPGDPTILIKLYEPLPSQFGVKDQLWVVEEVSNTQAYEVNFPFIPFIEDDFEYISGPNFSLDVKNETGKTGELFSYNTLINSDVTSSINQIKSLLEFKEININVDYEKFDKFINFSSAKTRLENFYYKVELIQSLQDDLTNGLDNVNGSTQNTFAFSSSKASITNQIEDIIKNFDGYEYFMYFNSGSSSSYPKQNTEPPFTLYPTTSTEALTWVGSADETSPYYGGLALQANEYDENNNNWLYNTIPEYLREDPENNKYNLFLDMVGQHYDNIWLYTKDITNKFNTDNRLDYGISKDLVADAIKDFGVKLYSNNFNTEDLYTAFLGITPSGSLFPNSKITSTLPTPEGLEYVDTKISSSNDIIPLDDVNKRLYKRIYHNIPYLLKTKGTIAGLKALITSYGIPDTILRINEFGGKDRNDAHDWDYGQHKYNYALSLDGNNFISSSFTLNPDFSTQSPKTLQFRFKTPGLPTGSNFDRSYQTLWLGNDNTAALILEYTGSGETKSNHSGSIEDPYNRYATLKFLPEVGVHPEFSASISLPFFNEEWWSVMATIERTNNTSSAILHAANKIGDTIGFHETGSVIHEDVGNYWDSITTSSFPAPTNWNNLGHIYKPFSGSFQEIRYYTEALSGSLFEDYVMNPYSFEGNNNNEAANTLAFRADLGTLRNTGSRTSVHPKVTGSLAYITSSFIGNSDFYVHENTFYETYEYIYLDQFPAGIKNRITDKITTNNHILPEGDTLSPIRSIQQTSFESSSYTPDINYIEVGFSPQDEINDDIIGQLGYFNLGDYIGDPRDISNSDRSYPALDKLRDEYFKKYIKSYDVVDFVRLMNFFDNSLFRMIKDFTPARTSLSSGVVVKQHILERNRQRPAQVESSNETLEGLIKPQSRNYETGSRDVGQYEYDGGSSIYRFNGGTGGSTERYNGLQTSPSASAYGLNNKFNLTQSYKEEKEGLLGSEEITIYDQSEFYDGIFSGSTIIATDKILNPNCAPYLTVPDIPIRLKPIFFTTGLAYNDDNFGNTVTKEDWANRLNSPKDGYAFILSEYDQNVRDYFRVTSIKLARRDENGFNISDYIGASDKIEFIFPENVNGTEYIIEGYVVNSGNILLKIQQGVGDTEVTSSAYGGSENWNLNVSSNFSVSSNTDAQSQGVFERPVTMQEQFFQYWPQITPDGLYDPNDTFNIGSDPSLHGPTILDSAVYRNGTYNPKRTSNVPWIISASITYSSSDTGYTGSVPSEGRLIQGGIYEDAGVGYTEQEFYVSPSNKYALSGSSQVYLGFSGAIRYEDLDTVFYFRENLVDIGSIVYTDPGATIRYQPSSNFTVWFKLGGDDEDGYVVQINSFYGIITQILEPFEGELPEPPIPATLNVVGSGSYSLATYNNPYIAGIDVDDENFNLNVNYKIPGNSGSGTPIAGNRQITTGGGAILDFNFDQFNFKTENYYQGLGLLKSFSQPLFGSNPPSWWEGNVNLDFTTAPGFTPIYDGTKLIGTNIDVDHSGSYTANPALILASNNPNFSTHGFFDRVYLASVNFQIDKLIVDHTPGSTYNIRLFEKTGLTGVQLLWSQTFNYVSGADTFFYQPSQLQQRLICDNINDPIKEYYIEITLPTGQSFKYSLKNYQFNVRLYNSTVGGGISYTITDIKYKQYTNITQRDQTFQLKQESLPLEIRAKLMYTGSDIAAGPIEITSSEWLEYDVPLDTFSGTLTSHSVSFPDSPIEQIEHNPNISGSMYFVEHEFKILTGSDLNPGYISSKIIPEDDPTYPQVYVTQSVSPPEGVYYITSSLNVYVGNGNHDTSVPTSVGTQILNNNTFTIDNSGSVGTFSAMGVYKGNFVADDTFRMGVSVDKTWVAGLNITSYTMSIFPSSSALSPINGGSSDYDTALYGQNSYGPSNQILPPALGNYSVPTTTDVILPGFFNAVGVDVLPFDLALDCQPLLNNFINGRESTFLMDVDYTNTSGSIIPVNQQQILDRTATKATTPDSNYTSLSRITPRYLGSKSTSRKINIWSETDAGTFGKLPTIERKNTYFAYFDSIENPYPNINDRVKLNLTNIIDQEGNALPPALSGLSRDIFERVFPLKSLGTVSIDKGSKALKSLNSPYPLSQIGSYCTPIMYSQNSSDGYATEIPLSGSRRISRYDKSIGEFATGEFTLFNVMEINDEIQLNLNDTTYRIVSDNNGTDDPSTNTFYIDDNDTIETQASDIRDILGGVLTGLFTVSEVNEVISFQSVYQTDKYNGSTIERGNPVSTPPKPFTLLGTIDGGVTQVGDTGSGIGFYKFSAIGPATDSTLPQQNIEYVLKPATVSEASGSTSIYDDTTGILEFPDDDGIEIPGEDLSNDQTIKLETAIQTTYVYDTFGTRDEMQVRLSLQSGSVNVPFAIEDVKLNVYLAGDKVRELGSVMDQGWFQFIGYSSGTRFDDRYDDYGNRYDKTGIFTENDYSEGTVLNNNRQVHFTVDWEMYRFLVKKGVYLKDGDILFKNPNLLSLEWVITANSGKYIVKAGDNLNWKIKGSMKTTSASNQPQSSFFPPDHPGDYAATKISTQGALDHLLEGDNIAQPPYWVFGTELSSFPTAEAHNILYMSSSNFNEAYGPEFYQGEIEYIPSKSPYFPGGVEPEGTNFDKIVNPLQIQEGDEIRFGNNENYTYIVQQVQPPQENVMRDGLGRVRLVLNREVSRDVNKDFFLVRRRIPDANSIYLGTTYPYTQTTPVTEETSPGILFPEFPSQELEISASSIVTDLISKGVIK
jgi:hypothetical protein